MTVLTDMLTEKIDAYIAEHKNEIIDTLMGLVRIPSVCGEKEEDAPFGKACNDLLTEAERIYKEMGLSPQNSPRKRLYDRTLRGRRKNPRHFGTW